MSSAELRVYPSERHSTEAVLLLKQALLMDPDMPKWKSADGKYSYLANPIDKVPPTARPYIPAWQFSQCLNAWQLCRVHNEAVDDVIPMDLYTIIAGVTVLITSHELTLEMLEENLESDTLTSINESAKLQCQLGWQLPEVRDYANIDNALCDLKLEMELFRIANSH
jgi:hypothetical protein